MLSRQASSLYTPLLHALHVCNVCNLHVYNVCNLHVCNVCFACLHFYTPLLHVLQRIQPLEQAWRVLQRIVSVQERTDIAAR